MPKMKWGGQALQERLENWEEDSNRAGFTPYDGPEPKKGMYGWTITRMLSGTSSGGFPQVLVHLELDPRGRTEHAKYKGFYMRDYVIVKEDGTTDFRVRPLLDALGVTVREFMTATIVAAEKDVDGFQIIQKIGKLTIGGNKVAGNIWKRRDSEYFSIRYYPPQSTDDSATADDSDDNDSDDNEAPF